MAVLTIRRGISIRKPSDLLVCIIAVAVYVGLIFGLEKFFPLMQKNNREIISGVVTFVVTLLLLFAFD